MSKGLCNAQTAAKLRKGIGFMRMVPDLHRMLTWMSGPMMKTFMMLATQKWYVTLLTLLELFVFWSVDLLCCWQNAFFHTLLCVSVYLMFDVSPCVCCFSMPLIVFNYFSLPSLMHLYCYVNMLLLTFSASRP